MCRGLCCFSRLQSSSYYICMMPVNAAIALSCQICSTLSIALLPRVSRTLPESDFWACMCRLMLRTCMLRAIRLSPSRGTCRLQPRHRAWLPTHRAWKLKQRLRTCRPRPLCMHTPRQKHRRKPSTWLPRLKHMLRHKPRPMLMPPISSLLLHLVCTFQLSYLLMFMYAH